MFLLGGCTAKKSDKSYTKTNLNCGFDTFCALSAYTKTEEEFNQYYSIMVNEFNYYHKLFDIYNNYDDINNLKTINDNAGIMPVKVEQPVIDMLNYAKVINKMTQGNFDITNGALLGIWRQYREDGKIANQNNKFGTLPSDNELNVASKLCGYDHLIIDEENSTVYLDTIGLSLDVGAIGKGYATEMIARKLEDKGLLHGAVNGGGNQRLINDKADGHNWNVGIQNPKPSKEINDSVIAIIKDLNDMAIATSGDYQNFYLGPNSNSYSHIIDFNTKYPANYYHSVTVVTSDSGLADCLSTTIFTMDYKSSLELLAHLKDAYNLDIGVVYISSEPLDKTSTKTLSQGQFYITYTSNLKDQITY